VEFVEQGVGRGNFGPSFQAAPRPSTYVIAADLSVFQQHRQIPFGAVSLRRPLGSVSRIATKLQMRDKHGLQFNAAAGKTRRAAFVDEEKYPQITQMNTDLQFGMWAAFARTGSCSP
jgi:hypothetical protein